MQFPGLVIGLKIPHHLVLVIFPRLGISYKVIPRNSDWFIVQFALVVIDHCSDFGIGFFDSHLKPTLLFFVNYCYCQFCVSAVLYCKCRFFLLVMQASKYKVLLA